MPRFSQQFIDQVAQATDIVDLIGQYVALNRKGKEFVGLCPFHDDKRPSLNVSATKQIFKCFACGAGGGVYQFLMLYDKLAFPEAVRSLAERTHIPLPADLAEPAAEGGLSKNDLLRVIAAADTFFRKSLRTAQGAEALDYARRRGLTEESIETFGLGYAPRAWDGLLKAARAKRVGENPLLAAGLVIRGEKGSCYDRFRNRLMFPIMDATGQTIAFGGRALAAGDQAKYLNSPESVAFDKSANLYALHWAREAVNSSGRAVVVEGYLDALIPHQMGVRTVVATLGTALTDRHVRLLSRYAREVVLVFDADVAGAAAAERALETFLAQQVHVRVATIPAGKDPCDFCLAEGAQAFGKLLDEAPDALEYIWQRRQAELEAAGGNLADRRRAVEDFLRLVAQSHAYGAIDAVRQGQLAQHIGHMLNIAPTELQQQMRRLSRQVRPAAARPVEPRQGPAAAPTAATRPQRHVLEVLLNQPDLFDEAVERIGPGDFTDPDLRCVAQAVWSAGQEGNIAIDQIASREEVAHLGGLISDLATAGEDRGNYDQTLRGAVDAMLHQREKQELQQIKSQGLTDDAMREIQRRQSAHPTHYPRIS